MTILQGHAFGVAIETELTLPGLHLGETDALPRVLVRRVPRDELLRRWSGGSDGDHLIARRDQALFHLDAAGTELLCAPQDPTGAGWVRALLDRGLGTVSLLHGRELLQAAAVATRAGTVAIAGPRGVGKSTLAAELIQRGGRLLADDLVALARADGGVLAHPAPALVSMTPTHAVQRLGRPLAMIEGRLWTRVDRYISAPARLDAIVLLSTRESGAPRVAALRGSRAELSPRLLGPRWLPGRRGSGLDLLASAELFRLERGDGSPTQLAELILETLARRVEPSRQGLAA